VDPGAWAYKLFARGTVERGETDDSLEQGGPVEVRFLFSGVRARCPRPIPQKKIPDSTRLALGRQNTGGEGVLPASAGHTSPAVRSMAAGGLARRKGGRRVRRAKLVLYGASNQL
jgi:hypothetical protein